MRIRGNGSSAVDGGLRLSLGRRQPCEIDRRVALDDEVYIGCIELHFLEHDRALPDRGELAVDDQFLEARDHIAGLLGQGSIAHAKTEGERIEGHLADAGVRPSSSAT